jgi:CheY-like chemotaxis protein
MDGQLTRNIEANRIAPAEGARILVVDDQDDVRRMLVTALEIEGHTVDEATNANEGLKRLEEARYNLVLSDYAMPGGTGAWMLHEAARRGVMNGALALIVTAHPHVRDLADVPVVTKPLDLDQFLEQVRRILTKSSGNAAGQATTLVELVLYISSASPASMQAKRNLERVLDRFEPSQVEYRICDLVKDPMAGESDRIAFTPTLVKRSPEPRMWILGNLRDPETLSDVLRACGVDGKE